MATQQEKTVETTTAKANSAHGLRDFIWSGIGRYLLCRKNIEQNTT
jgi:hypothetical protein